jgi:hypothetical protein
MTMVSSLAPDLKALIHGFDKSQLSRPISKPHESSNDDVTTNADSSKADLIQPQNGKTAARTARTKPQFLDGKELQPPRLHPVNWRDGQIFKAEDDPDRTAMVWMPPSFVSNRDPSMQIPKTRVEELDVSGVVGANKNSFARVVYNLFEPGECAELLARINEKGFTPALLNVGRGMQKLATGIRDGQRVIVDCPELTKYLFQLLEPYLPTTLRGNRLIELNERARFLCYTPGQQFDAHCDGRYQRMQPHPNAGDYSMVTVQFYLHDVPQSHGGATTFLGTPNSEDLACQPVGGSALIFTQDLLHEGSLLNAGLKYTLRTEAMYRRPGY